MASTGAVSENPILHVVVVGFHHKKGCQVEYSYPPLIPGNPVNSQVLPGEWRHLPSLALPDGAHNYTKDTTYFHIPSLDGSYQTVYGVSCYRQMDSKDLLSKSADVTRNTVQKSVCVLSRLPLYGLIQAKLELITHAYFDERDFSKVELLRETYQNLTLSLKEGSLNGTNIYLGLSAREVVTLFKHKILVLFKLLLLERRVLFFGKPVKNLSHTMMTVLSLFPGLIEFGLEEAASYSAHRQLSPTLKFHDSDPDGFLEVSYRGQFGDSADCPVSPSQGRMSTSEPESQMILRDENTVQQSLEKDNALIGNKTIKDSENLQHKIDSQLPSDDKPAFQENMSLFKHQESSSPRSMDHELVWSKGYDPLADVNSITHIEAVQSPRSSNLVRERSKDGSDHSVSPPRQPGKMLARLEILADDTDTIQKSESIEELDSPESISKIDREDCFSWEEDRIFLEIDQDQESKCDSDKSDANLFVDKMNVEKNKTESANTCESGVADIDNKSSDSRSTDIGDSMSESSSGQVKSLPCSPAKVETGGNLNLVLELPGENKSEVVTAVTDSPVKQKSPKDRPPDLPADSTKLTTHLHQDEYGLPLAIFAKGCLCHPYLSLQFYDLMEDVNVRGFLIGATNILFKQRKHMTDVVVELNDSRIEFHDSELKKQLTLTTADLRFADCLVKSVIEDRNIFLDGTEWEGGDEWIRAQFREYLLSLLATTLAGDDKLLEDFGTGFVHTWKTTHNYRVWQSSAHPLITHFPQGHPFQGHLNVSDLKVRLSHTIQSTDKGKKINAAVSQTGKIVVQTGKAVGGALNQAKSAVTSWFSNFTHDWKQDEKGQKKSAEVQE